MSNFNMKIKISDAMTDSAIFGIDENKMVRMSQKLRYQLGVEIGKQISFDTCNGEIITLQIGPSFKDDYLKDEGICYVTEYIFKAINVENTHKYTKCVVKGITLGCDPELFLVDRHTGRSLRAHMFLKKWGEVGHDGILAEIRPKPSTSENTITDTMYELINKLRYLIDNNTLNYDSKRIMLYGASSYDNTTAGFHLHYGLPKEILGRKPINLLLMNQVVRAMDYYVGIPSIILEGSSDSSRRSNLFISYGKPSDFRLDDRTLEYRVPGGNMLRHPILSKGLIALGAVVMEDIISKIKTTTNNFKQLYWMQQEERIRELYPHILPLQCLYETLCTPSVNKAKSYLTNIFNDVGNMTGFQDREIAISALFSAIDNNKQFSNDIESNWRSFYEQEMGVHQPPSTSAFNCARS